VNAFLDGLTADGRGPTTVRRIVAVVQAALRTAFEDQVINDNPGIGVRLPRVEKKDLGTWTPEQVGTFLDVAAEHRLGALFELVMFTGLRRGEALGLKWSDVDLEGHLLTVRANRTQVGGKVVEQTPKTKAGVRTIELADATVGALIAWQIAQQAEADAWGEAWSHTGYVFSYENGEPLLPQYATRLFDKLRVKAGLPKMTFHGQRHEAISLMLEGGVSIAIASKRAGHSSIQITADRYGHLIGSASKDAAETAVALVPRKTDVHST
jgi:integrase